MSVCDVCGLPGLGTYVGAESFRRAVFKSGFNPLALGLVKDPVALASATAWYEGWKNTVVAQDTSGWNICPRCMVSLTPYLERGTRPTGVTKVAARPDPKTGGAVGRPEKIEEPGQVGSVVFWAGPAAPLRPLDRALRYAAFASALLAGLLPLETMPHSICSGAGLLCLVVVSFRSAGLLRMLGLSVSLGLLASGLQVVRGKGGWLDPGIQELLVLFPLSMALISPFFAARNAFRAQKGAKLPEDAKPAGAEARMGPTNDDLISAEVGGPVETCDICGLKFYRPKTMLEKTDFFAMQRVRVGCSHCGARVCFSCAASAADARGQSGNCFCAKCGAELGPAGESGELGGSFEGWRRPAEEIKEPALH